MKERMLEIINMKRDLVKAAKELEAEYGITLCGFMGEDSVLHIYNGILEVANAFSEILHIEPFIESAGSSRAYFNHDGVKVFEILNPKPRTYEAGRGEKDAE